MAEAMGATEKIGSYAIHGTKGLVGKTFNRNIIYLAIDDKSRKGLAGLRSLIQSFESEAINAGANKISIWGGAIANEGLLNPKTAAYFGYNLERSGDNIILEKILIP